LQRLCDGVICPPHLASPPKGAYSKLISELLCNYLETIYKANIIDILAAGNETSGEFEDVQNYLAKGANDDKA